MTPRRFDEERASERAPHPTDGHWLARKAWLWAIAIVGIGAVVVWWWSTGGEQPS